MSSRQSIPAAGKSSTTRALGGWRRLWTWLRRRGNGSDEGAAFAFSARLLSTVVVSFALVGVVGYFVLEQSSAQRQIGDYASSQRADGDAFAAVGTRSTSKADALGDIARLLDGIARRPGTREAMLIDQRHVIRAAANSAVVGRVDSDVTNGPVSTWELARNAYRLGERPPAYAHRTATHPSIYDDFDSIMAAAWLLSSDGAGLALHGSAWIAAFDYYGHDAAGVRYADVVLARAIGWSQHGFCPGCEVKPALVRAVHEAYGEHP
jgi:hypothetical protein